MKCQFFGTCVDNPFSSVKKLDDVVYNGSVITKKTFLKRCEVDGEIKKDFKRFPNDYRFYKNGKIYFYEWSSIEHFFK